MDKLLREAGRGERKGVTIWESGNYVLSDVEVQKPKFFWGGAKWGSFSLGFDGGLPGEMSCSSQRFAWSPAREPSFAVGFACSSNAGRAARLMGFHLSD